jgi:hypothetical protein
MQKIIQNTSGNKENKPVQISSMVDSRVNSHEERIYALRRRYQRTTNNEDLRGSPKNQYHEEKTKYQAAIKKEKLNPGKNTVTLLHLRIHGMLFTNLLQIK